MRKRVVNIALLLALLVNLITPLTSRAESTNRNEVRQGLSNGGWSVIYGDLIQEADYALFILAVAEAVACECPAPIAAYFDEQMQAQIDKIKRSAPDIAQEMLVNLLIQAFDSDGAILQYGQLEVSAGLATYKRWDDVIYDEPRSYQCKEDLPWPLEGWTWSWCTTTERVTRTVPWPNNFQPYFRFRLRADSGPSPDNPNPDPNPTQPRQLNEVWRVSVPQDVHDMISKLYRDGRVIKQVAFTPDNGWIILTDYNGAWWHGIPQEVSDKIKELWEAEVELKQIAFTADGGWIILYNERSAVWSGIPSEAGNKIKELSDAGYELKQIAFAADNGWVILFGKNGVSWRGIPQQTSDKIKELIDAGYEPKVITFTPTNGWIVLLNVNAFWAQGIPQNAFDELVALQNGGSELIHIAFTPTNNGSVMVFR